MYEYVCFWVYVFENHVLPDPRHFDFPALRSLKSGVVFRTQAGRGMRLAWHFPLCVVTEFPPFWFGQRRQVNLPFYLLFSFDADTGGGEEEGWEMRPA